MSYRELIFTVHAEVAEPLGDTLLELGALSVTVEDAAAGGYDESPLYGEPGLSPEVQAWDRSSVTALFNPEIDESANEQFIPNLLRSLSEAGYRLSPPEEKIVAEQDWVRLTQSQFAPIQIGKRIWVVPSWHEAPNDPDAICLAVDPGLAFGTGSHPTTRLCLQWLEQHPQFSGHSLLDYGCGSGILAIAAAKLGYEPVVGTDIDPQAMVAARSNAEINRTKIAFVLPNDDAPELHSDTKYDIVMANILANPLQVLAPALVNKMRPDGHIVLSGVLARQAEEVIATYAQWLSLSVWQESEGWVCLHGVLPITQPIERLKSKIQTLIQKKTLKVVLLACLCVVLLIVAEHLSRNSLLHALAPTVDTSSSTLVRRSFSILSIIDEKICSTLGCINAPVRDFEAWKISAVTFDIENPQKGPVGSPNQSILQIDLQNRLAIAVLWPNLELTFTDIDEAELNSIQFTPEQWLPNSWKDTHPQFLNHGAPAGETFQTTLVVPLPENAAGYRVRIFYP